MNQTEVQTEAAEKKPKPDVMRLISVAIIKYRYVVFLLFAAAAVYCVLSIGKIRVNSDLTAFLPEETETRRGLTIMEDEFITYASASVMVSNVTYDMADALAEEIGAFEHVTGVAFDDTAAHFVNASALFSISFDGTEDDPGVLADMTGIRELVTPYDNYIATSVGADFSSHLA